jgi:hypothetical protein
VDNGSKRCRTCHRDLPESSFSARRASKDGLQNACRACNSAWAAAHRPRKLAAPPLVGEGEKWCRECDTIKPLDAFAFHAKMRDGRQTSCRECFASRYRNKQEAAGKLVRPANIPDDHKFCRTCRTVQPRTGFGLRRSSAGDGRMSACKECRKLQSRAGHLKRQYDLTEQQVEALREAQGGVCAICRSASAVHVDHDHETGKVRGMLCFSCNAALGHFKDDPAVLRRAARYLVTYATNGVAGPSTSHRDEVAWEIVLRHRTASRDPGFLERLVPTGGPSLLEQLVAARLAEHGGGPPS